MVVACRVLLCLLSCDMRGKHMMTNREMMMMAGMVFHVMNEFDLIHTRKMANKI